MAKLTKVTKVEGGYVCEFDEWFGCGPYFTEVGVHWWGLNGNQMGLLHQCRLDDAFKERFDWLNGKYWDWDTHPSDSMKAQQAAQQLSAHAKTLKGSTQ